MGDIPKFIPEEIILEILVRVGDPIAFIRCGAVLKRWRELVADPSIVCRRDSTLMKAVRVHKATFVLSKSVPDSWSKKLVFRGKELMRSPIATLFPELRKRKYPPPLYPVTLINANFGVEKVATITHLVGKSGLEFEICPGPWRDFVAESCISGGDVVCMYACERRGGERCLLFLNRGGAPKSKLRGRARALPPLPE